MNQWTVNRHPSHSEDSLRPDIGDDWILHDKKRNAGTANTVIFELGIKKPTILLEDLAKLQKLYWYIDYDWRDIHFLSKKVIRARWRSGHLRSIRRPFFHRGYFPVEEPPGGQW